MKIKLFCFFLIIIASSSCGKKSTIGLGKYEFSKVVVNNETVMTADVSEHTCIDNKLTKELDSGEAIKNMVINDDFTFCNGVRVRLKTYQFNSKKYKAYGYVISNSGLQSCLTESTEFTHKMFFGDQGILNGNNIKILIGGHQLDSADKIVPSEHKLARYVKFDWGSYNGELAIFEKGKIRCWAIE